MLKYLLFIIIGIILYIYTIVKDGFSIGGQVWAIPVGNNNMVLGNIEFDNSIQLSTPPRLHTYHPDTFHTYVDVNRVYNFRNGEMRPYGYYFITDIDPSYGLTQNLQDAIDLERTNQFGPQIQRDLPSRIEFRNAHMPIPRRTDTEIQSIQQRRSQAIVGLNAELDRQAQERLGAMQRDQARQEQVRQDLDVLQTAQLARQNRQVRIGRFACSTANE
jgi:hypothetical protein